MPLIPLLLGIAPTVASWIMGDRTGGAVAKVTDIARSVLGTDDPGRIEAAIGADPALALQFKQALIEAESADRQRQHDEVLARLKDVQDARGQTVKLAEAHSPIAWGAPVISFVVLVTFAVMLYVIIAKPMPGATSESAQLLLGMLGTMATAVVSYWVGSSRGSESKQALISQLTRGAGK